jgi:hypothetical protein
MFYYLPTMENRVEMQAQTSSLDEALHQINQIDEESSTQMASLRRDVEGKIKATVLDVTGRLAGKLPERLRVDATRALLAPGLNGNVAMTWEQTNFLVREGRFEIARIITYGDGTESIRPTNKAVVEDWSTMGPAILREVQRKLVQNLG